MKRNLQLLILVLICIVIRPAYSQQTATIGKTISTVQLVDASNHPKAIPFIGDKVMMIFYMDVDAKNVNNPLSEALKEKKYPKDKVSGLGIINCKDTWIPEALIRKGIQKSEKKSSESYVLLDTNLTLSKSWGLGDCNDRVVIIVIGKDSRIKFIKSLKSQDECKAIVPAFLKTLDKELSL